MKIGGYIHKYIVSKAVTALLVPLLFSLFVVNVQAQKAYRPIKAALKDKKASEALTKVRALLADTVHASDPVLLEYGIDASVMQNEALNEKIYLKQKYDTAQFFQSVLSIADFIVLSENAIARAETKSELKQKKKLQARHRVLLARYYQNLLMGGRYFFTKSKNEEALKYLTLGYDIPKMELWNTPYPVSKSDWLRNAYYALKAHYDLGQYDEMQRYVEIAKPDSIYGKPTLEYLCLIAMNGGNPAVLRNYLEEGVKRYPLYPFFFTNLVDDYNSTKEYLKADSLVEQMLKLDSANAIILEAKSLVQLNLENYETAISFAEQSIRTDSAAVESYYYAGAAYCGLAANVKLPKSVNSKTYGRQMSQKKALYQKALPFLETYKKLAPHETQRWGKLLYQVYLTLNMGSQFREIDKLLNQ